MAVDIQDKQFENTFLLLSVDLEPVTVRPIHRVPRLISSPLQPVESVWTDFLLMNHLYRMKKCEQSPLNRIEILLSYIKHLGFLRSNCRGNLLMSHEETLPPCVCNTSNTRIQSRNDGFMLTLCVNHEGKRQKLNRSHSGVHESNDQYRNFCYWLHWKYLWFHHLIF